MNILDDTCTMYSVNVFDKQDSTDVVEFVEDDEPLSRVILGFARILGSGTNFNGGFGLTKAALTVKSSSEDMDSYIRESSFYWRLLNTMRLTCACFKRHDYIGGYTISEEVRNQTIKLLSLFDINNELIIDIEVHWIATGALVPFTRCSKYVSDVIHKIVASKLNSLLSSNELERPKDLYDIYCLNQLYGVNTKIIAKFTDRKINWNNYPVSANQLRNWISQYDTLQLVDAATQTSRLKPNFFTVRRDFVTIMYNLYFHKEMQLCPRTYMFYNEYKSRAKYPFDKLVGSHGKKYIVMFDRALWHAGLIKDCNPQLTLACTDRDISYTSTFMTTFIDNPWFQWYEYTTPSPKSSNILYPTAERALVECIFFQKEFNNDNVIDEAMTTYWIKHKSWDKLFEMSIKFQHNLKIDNLEFTRRFTYDLSSWITSAEY